MITVAIDGPAGVGKSSISKALASYFSLAYLDTGAMYRAAAWWCLHKGVDLDDPQAVTDAVLEFCSSHLDIGVDPENPRVYSDDEDISDEIRSEEVSSCVSKVSSIQTVRQILIDAQRRLIAREANIDSYSQGRGVVAEGRDITTVVAPDANVRVLLTARPEVRQARRSGQSHDQKVGKDDVAARDKADSKVTHFLTAAEGVTTVDNSDMNFRQTLDAFVRMVENSLEEQGEDPQNYTEAAALEGAESFNDALADYELSDEDQDLLSSVSDDDEDSIDAPRKAVGVVAVVGRPNVGKSSLVNRILGRRAAVVEDTPGVTRDRVSYEAEWAGTDFLIVDTGGWEADVEGIESAIAAQAKVAVDLADAVILVVDGQVGMTDTDERIVKMLRAAGKPVTVAVNKVDRGDEEYMAADFWGLGLGEPFPISAMHGRGVGDLLDDSLAKLKKADKTSGLLKPTGLRRVALVGRPNVGKSSLLNQLAHEDRSVVHDEAGTTRDPVDEVVTLGDKDWLFIDTAGIKRRLHKISGAEYYSSLRTQAALERAELALVLFDVSKPIAEQDLRVMSQAVDAGRAVVLVFNKWDLLDDFGRERIERLYATEFERVTWAQRINLSAKTAWHVNRIEEAMETALTSWDKRISTGKLNTFLGKIQSAHPHPLRGGKQPRILFATQASTRPPRFVIFASGFLDHGYRRFIERSLREEFGFEGTPIQISVHVREKKKR
ncbi:MAG: bifunctional cytidylate kinase/GTPase Der [Bifidobacteriaceae bacterium]|nr:bifunctional cytidylate kinase/GTPase Der [Bifidobacteriaceae bacterium]MCI1979348.1 bifunctional cytidylate kinase/GTPase Der [Bifidobacteriaceae bacterium]